MTAEPPTGASSPHRRVVGAGLQVLGGLLGIPSLVCGVGLALNALALRRLAAPDGGHFYDIGTYGLVGLIANGGRLVAKGLGVLAGVAGWMSGMLAAAFFAAALYAVLLFVVGRGVSRRATWARILGGLLSLGFLGVALVAVGSAEGAGKLVAALLASLPLYVLWTLIWRYR